MGMKKMNDGGAMKIVILSCDYLISDMEDGLHRIDKKGKDQILQSFEQMMDRYEQLQIVAPSLGSHRDKGNIKARLTRVKRELQDAQTAVEFDQYEKAEEMLKSHLLPALKRFREGLWPR